MLSIGKVNETGLGVGKVVQRNRRTLAGLTPLERRVKVAGGLLRGAVAGSGGVATEQVYR